MVELSVREPEEDGLPAGWMIRTAFIMVCVVLSILGAVMIGSIAGIVVWLVS